MTYMQDIPPPQDLRIINLILCAAAYRDLKEVWREYALVSAFSPSCSRCHWPGTGQLLLAGPFCALRSGIILMFNASNSDIVNAQQTYCSVKCDGA